MREKTSKKSQRHKPLAINDTSLFFTALAFLPTGLHQVKPRHPKIQPLSLLLQR